MGVFSDPVRKSGGGGGGYLLRTVFFYGLLEIDVRLSNSASKTLTV